MPWSRPVYNRREHFSATWLAASPCIAKESDGLIISYSYAIGQCWEAGLERIVC